MSDTPASRNEPRESDLLLPFESQNIPEDYREYYRIKRNNFFASIQGFPEMWKYYILLDGIWLREFGDLKPLGDATQFVPLILFFNAHAKMRISIELALSGCLAEARSILRDAVEFVAHAHRMRSDPKLQKVWLSKNEEGQAFEDAFVRHKKEGLFRGLDELHQIWGQLSETGSHATLNSMCDRFAAVKSDDGGQEWGFNYCGVERRMWALSLFSMLLTCFVMERIFYGDYEDRLRLDHILVGMRGEFERFKEQVREHLKVRYEVKPPAPKSTIHVP
ncbi:MAG: hypothetical protein ABSH05_00460 [Bryobacteraceae bacterium]|jgi:hypothetical protein